jgi:hypothetical protein
MDPRLVGAGCSAVLSCTALSAALPALHPTMAVVGLVGVALGAAAALDDEAAAVTDASPSTARRRILDRVPVALTPLSCWAAAGLLLKQRYPDWPLALGWVIGAVVAIAAFGLAAARRRAGTATPGEAVGTGIAGLVLVLLAAPAVRGVTPFTPEPTALFWWAPVLMLGLSSLAWGTRDRMRPQLSRGHTVTHRHGHR